MNLRTPSLMAVVALFVAGVARADSFEQIIADALRVEGIIPATAAQKKKSANDFVLTQFHGEHGGPRGGERGGERGGDHGGWRGGERGGDRGGDRGGWRGGERGGDRDRGGDRREPRFPEPRFPDRDPRHDPWDGHRPDRHDGWREPHRDWGRWQGHPGWGHRYDRWEWDRFDHPHWWGWIVFAGASRVACFEHYGALLNQCYDSVRWEEDTCEQSCSVFDGACADQCRVNRDYGNAECISDYNERTAYCPF